MSSRELLVLLDGLPDASKFKEASERTFRVVEHIAGDHKGQLSLLRAIGAAPDGVEVIAEYVDWTHDRKLLARNTTEIASMRADGRDYQPDLTGLIEPLTQIVAAREQKAEEEFAARAGGFIRNSLHRNDERR
jgi:hypothetical protein